MKAGYAALLGLVLAYSAYQGGGSSPSNVLHQGSNPGNSVAGPTRSLTSSPGTEAFPTISGGMCRLILRGDGTEPCGTCKAICPAKELRGLVEDYFRGESTGDIAFSAKHWNVPRAEQANIRFVITSLPDPVHTHMALLFDRGIETIQSAAQASGYLFSRAWMPWDISTHNESTDFTVRMAETQFRDQVETLPGLMIFQKTRAKPADADSILFVFVVGETPTGGLHVEQFQNALNIRQSILASSNSALDEAQVLRIDGPTFSGSLRSLNAILYSTPHNQLSKILIRSGSISSFQAVHQFCEATIREWPNANGGRPDFETLQFSDEYQDFYLKVFFRNREDSHSHVAILSEDETAFGNQDVKEETPDAEDQFDQCPHKPSNSSSSFLHLYFPREIAQLRDAYQRNAKEVATDGTKGPAQNGLALSLGVTGNDGDSIAPYSPLQTPLSQESILQAIVATLRRQHAKVVIIRATDPLDMIFLSRYLRQNYPQARLVTVGADILMVHDFYDPRFHGILAVTSYPLLTGARFPFWIDPAGTSSQPKVQRLFADSYAVGGFNAFLSLLAPQARTAPAGGLPAAEYEQFGLPAFLQPKGGVTNPWRPHLWLMSVGRDGYWPVSVLDEPSPGDLRAVEHGIEKTIPEPPSTVPEVSATPKLPRRYSVHFSVSWTILWVLACAFTLVLAYLIAVPQDLSRSEILGRFSGLRSPERNGLLFSGSLLLLATQTIFVFPAVCWLGRFGNFRENLGILEWSADLLDGMWPVMALYILSALLLGVACALGFHRRGSDTLAGIGAVLCGTVIVATIWSTFCRWMQPLGNAFGIFLYRYVHAGSGVSPSLPILFLMAAWIWWFWQSFTGVTSTEEKYVVFPRLEDFTEAAVPGASDRVRLKALAAAKAQWPWQSFRATPHSAKIAIPGILGLIVILLLMRPSEIAEAFESNAYKIPYWFFLYSCLLLVCYLLTHMVGLWVEFRALLRSIERTPFRRGFADVKNLTWKPLWKLAGNGRQEFVELLGGEIDTLTQIENSGWLDAGLVNAIVEARNATDNVSAEYEKLMGKRPDREIAENVRRRFQTLQEKLAIAATQALIHASRQWKSQSYAPPVLKKDSEKDSDGKTTLMDVPAADPTLRAVEHFLCLFYLNIILVPLRRLQTLILAMAGVFVFVLISYSSYPFESRESFHALLISIFFVISLVVGLVYGQMYANPLLSRITNTKPGDLGLDFWVRLGTFIFVPLLSLVSVQFPEINSFLFSWLQPALQSIK